MNTLWGWIAAAGAALVAALLFVSGQRDRAREKMEQAKGKAQAEKRTREREQEIDEHATEARRTTEDQTRENDKRPPTERPTGKFD